MLPSATAWRRRVEARALIAAGLLLLAAPSARAQTPEPPISDSTPSFLELADRLRVTGSYSECVVEALRHASQHPDEREAGFDRAALCLSLAGRFLDARRVMLSMPELGTPLSARGRLRVCLSEVFLSRDAAEPACPGLLPPAGDARARHTLVMRDVHARRWDQARVGLAAGATDAGDAVLASWRRKDAAWVREYDQLPRKSPWLAAGLSAVVPGLGRVYLGHVADGILSFVVVGLTGGLAAHGFYEDGTSSVRGWILASTSFLLYAGNVYGSAVGAVVQRRDAEAELDKRVEDDYRHRLEP
jgi:TM2 domain-containing membrane protein YozV